MTEEWRPVVGHLGEYAVSNLGRVMAMSFYRSGLPGIMSQSLVRGYPRVSLKGRSIVVHKLVAEAFLGLRPDGMTINHIDGCKMNNAASNLEYVTPSENQRHACRLGLINSKGERHSQAKLTDAQVIDIRARLERGDSQKETARRVGVDPSTISRIKCGNRWPHLIRKAG